VPQKQDLQNEGYRRGVVLGLTIAEIILLILFALLLAMTGVLIKREAVIKTQAEAQAETRALNQKLTPELAAKLTELNINIMTPDGASRLLGILEAAQLVSPIKKTKKENDLERACQAGLQLQNALGKNLSAVDFIKSAQQLSDDFQTLKKEAMQCSSSAILPPCYGTKGAPPIFIYDINVKLEGLIFSDTVPENLRARFATDFKKLPALNKPLSIAEFKEIARPFASYGKSNQCKFYVKVYDEMGSNKDLFKSRLKLIEESFVWTFMMTTKEDADGKNLIFFPAGQGIR
jgi:hypothetical protein